MGRQFEPAYFTTVEPCTKRQQNIFLEQQVVKLESQPIKHPVVHFQPHQLSCEIQKIKMGREFLLKVLLLVSGANEMGIQMRGIYYENNKAHFRGYARSVTELTQLIKTSKFSKISINEIIPSTQRNMLRFMISMQDDQKSVPAFGAAHNED